MRLALPLPALPARKNVFTKYCQESTGEYELLGYEASPSLPALYAFPVSYTKQKA